MAVLFLSALVALLVWHEWDRTRVEEAARRERAALRAAHAMDVARVEARYETHLARAEQRHRDALERLLHLALPDPEPAAQLAVTPEDIAKAIQRVGLPLQEVEEVARSDWDPLDNDPYLGVHRDPASMIPPEMGPLAFNGIPADALPDAY